MNWNIITQIEITKKTQGYTLGKHNEGENPSKTLPFIQADTLPFEIGFYSTSERRIITLCLAHLQIWLYLVENHWIWTLGCFSKKLLAFTRNILNLEPKTSSSNLQKLSESGRWIPASDLEQTGGLHLGSSSRSGTPLREEHGSTLGFLISLVVREI